MTLQLFTAVSAAIILSASAWSQDEGRGFYDAPVSPPDDSVQMPAAELELPDNVQEVRSPGGDLIEPFVQAQRCVEAGCSTAIINLETGEIAFAFEQWQPGFIATLNGEQVVHVRDLSAAPETE
jgi:hypothetical protein